MRTCFYVNHLYGHDRLELKNLVWRFCLCSKPVAFDPAARM